MNLLGRIYLLLLSLLLVVLLAIFLLSPQTIGEWAGNMAEVSALLRIIIAALLAVVLLALVYVQVRPARKPAATGLIMRASGAVTEVSVESARDRILKAVSDVAGVVSVEARVTPIRARADVDLDVEVLGEDVRLPDKQKEINRALKQVINKQLGLQMAGRPRVHIRLHGEQPAPSVISPALAAPPPSEPVELEREAPAGLFAGLRRGLDRSAQDEATVIAVEKPAPAPVTPQPKPEPEPEPEREKGNGGLLGGLFRSRDRQEVQPEKPAPDAEQDMFADTPELAALLRAAPASPASEPAPPQAQAEPPASPDTSQVEEEEEEADTIILDEFDLARELAHTASDELVDAVEEDVEEEDSTEEEETDEPKPDGDTPPASETRPPTG